MSKLILIILLVVGFYLFINIDKSSQGNIIQTALSIPSNLGNGLEQTANRIDEIGYDYGVGK